MALCTGEPGLATEHTGHSTCMCMLAMRCGRACSTHRPRPLLPAAPCTHLLLAPQRFFSATLQNFATQSLLMAVGVGARKALAGAGLDHHYLEYGSYLRDWRTRLALKMWTGWPTFPMVFVRGQLVGGAQDLEKLIASGELPQLLAG